MTLSVIQISHFQPPYSIQIRPNKRKSQEIHAYFIKGERCFSINHLQYLKIELFYFS